MITLDQVRAKQDELFKKATGLVEKKGADYNRKQQHSGDTLFNMRVSTILGITETNQQGVLTRLSDKFMRLASLADASQEEANKDESIQDTVVDIWNYTTYLLLFREEQKKQLQADTFAQVYTDEAKKSAVEGGDIINT